MSTPINPYETPIGTDEPVADVKNGTPGSTKGWGPIKAIAIGFAIDIGLSLALGIAIGVYLGIKLLTEGTKPDDVEEAVEVYMTTHAWVKYLAIGGGALATAIGTFVMTFFSRSHHLWLALTYGLVSLVWFFMPNELNATWLEMAIPFVVSLAIGAGGGYLLNAKHRQQAGEPAGI